MSRAISALPVSFRSPAAFIRPCTGDDSGPCASSPASARLKRATGATTTCSNRETRVCQWPSTCRLSWATTPTISRSRGEVGRCGVAVDSVADMEILFRGIPLDQVSVSMTINGPAIVLFAMYLVVAERQGVKFRDLQGTLQNDILKEYIAQKEWICPPAPSLKMINDIIRFCVESAPRYHPVSISGYHIREAGSTAVQELAFTFMTA